MDTELRCQSCYMPMPDDSKKGTVASGAPSEDYCVYCYQGGTFTSEQSLDEAVESNIPFWKGEGESDDVARERIMAVFPKLKRWHV